MDVHERTFEGGDWDGGDGSVHFADGANHSSADLSLLVWGEAFSLVGEGRCDFRRGNIQDFRLFVDTDRLVLSPGPQLHAFLHGSAASVFVVERSFWFWLEPFRDGWAGIRPAIVAENDMVSPNWMHRGGALVGRGYGGSICEATVFGPKTCS